MEILGQSLEASFAVCQVLHIFLGLCLAVFWKTDLRGFSHVKASHTPSFVHNSNCEQTGCPLLSLEVYVLLWHC
jgi:hypothetical protein